MWFGKVGFQKLIHKCLFLSYIRRRDVGSVDKGVGPVRVVRSKPIGLIPDVCAGKRCRFNIGDESRWK